MSDTCSLTPPLSPLKQYGKENAVFHDVKEITEYAKVPYFTCNGYVSPDDYTCSSKSYLKNKILQNIFDNKLCYNEQGTLILLYGKTFSKETALLTKKSQLFSCTKKYFQNIKKLTYFSSVHVSDKVENYFHLRHEICSFLTYMKVFFQNILSQILSKRFLQHNSDAYVSQLKRFLPDFVKEIKLLLLFTGRITDIPEHICIQATSEESIRKSSACYHYFHLQLDIWWSILEILHTVDVLCREIDFHVNTELYLCSNQCTSTLFMQVSCLLLYDLCSMSLNLYEKNKSCFGDKSPFLCTCIREFWILLLNVIDKRNEIFKEKSFWCQMHEIFQLFGSSNEGLNVEVQLECFNLVKKQVNSEVFYSFCLWFVNHLSLLYKFDIDGHYLLSKKLVDCYFIVKYIIISSLSLNSDGKNEKFLRDILLSTSKVISLWEPSGDILFPLTDFYIKKIDDSFGVPSNEIQSFSFLFKDSRCWLEYIESLSSESNTMQESNSFYWYLKILATQLSNSSNSNLWRQLKGRIWSKFTSKRLKDLSEVGLQNCFSIFLTVIYSASIEEVALKLCELVDLMQNVATNRKKQMVSWKALFVLLYIYQMQNKSLEKVATNAVKLFNKACDEYSHICKGSMQQNNLMNLIIIYIDNLQTVFEQSVSLTSSEYLLIGSGFPALMSSCSNELSYILEVVLAVLLKFHNLVIVHKSLATDAELQYELLLQSLFTHIFPFVEKHVTTDTAACQLADIAAVFTFLLCQFRSSTEQLGRDYVSLFKYFGCSERVNVCITCRYSNFILNENSILHILAEIDGFFILLVQSFLRCCICLVPPSNQMQEFVQKVFRRQELYDLFPDLKGISFRSGEHDFLCIKFFRTIGASYKKCESPINKKVMYSKAQLFFKNMYSIISTSLKHSASSAFLNHMYNITGHLVQYCSLLLYSKFDKDCVLPGIIDVLLIPHVIFRKDKVLPANLFRIVKEYLPLFFKGLNELDYKTDAYVQRKLKEIISHYLTRLPLSGNPLIGIAVETAMQESREINFQLFCFIISAVKDEFMSSVSSQSVVGFSYCTEIFKKVPVSAKKQICKILVEHLFFLFLKSEDKSLYLVKDLVNLLFSFLKSETDLIYQKNLLIPALTKFIEVALAWSHFKAFRVLEVVTNHFPAVMSDIIPFLTRFVKDLEQKRGSGDCDPLRKELISLTQKVQKALAINKS